MVLIGSLHFLPDVPTVDLISYRHVIERADGVIFETNFEREGIPSVAFLSSGRLPDFIGIERYSAVSRLFRSLGLDDDVQTLKPWFVTLRLGVVLQLRSGATLNGVDRQLWTYSGELAKPRLVLEGVEVFECFDSSPVSESVAMLDRILNDPELPVRQFRALFAAWSMKDYLALDSVLTAMAGLAPQAYQCLFERRNRLWLPYILNAIRHEKEAAFVVGCGHIKHGDVSLERLLGEHGYVVEGAE